MTIADSTEHDSDARAAAVEMLKSGEAAPSDVAHLAGVDRRVVAYWIKAAKIDAAKAYQGRLVRAWRKHLAKVKGSAKPRAMTKTEMRSHADKAVAEFNARRHK